MLNFVKEKDCAVHEVLGIVEQVDWFLIRAHWRHRTIVGLTLLTINNNTRE